MSLMDEAVNPAAPELALDEVRQVEAVIQPKTPSAQLMKTASITEIAPGSNLVVEVQRLLDNLGYRPGPVDRIIGARRLARSANSESRSGGARPASSMRPCSRKCLSRKYNKHVSSRDKRRMRVPGMEARINCAGLLLLYRHQLAHNPQVPVAVKLVYAMAGSGDGSRFCA